TQDSEPSDVPSSSDDTELMSGTHGKTSAGGDGESEKYGPTTSERGGRQKQDSDTKGQQVKPSIAIRLSDNQGYGPLTVNFDAVATGKDIYWTIRPVDGDQLYGFYGESGSFKFEKPGKYIIKATLEGSEENVSTESMVVINKEPVVGKE